MSLNSIFGRLHGVDVCVFCIPKGYVCTHNQRCFTGTSLTFSSQLFTKSQLVWAFQLFTAEMYSEWGFIRSLSCPSTFWFIRNASWSNNLRTVYGTQPQSQPFSTPYRETVLWRDENLLNGRICCTDSTRLYSKERCDLDRLVSAVYMPCTGDR